MAVTVALVAFGFVVLRATGAVGGALHTVDRQRKMWRVSPL
jgi:hypothetical protein